MKILILSDSVFIPTGYRNQSMRLAQYLTKQGHEVHYMMNAYNGITLDYAKLEDGTECNFKMYGEMQPGYFANSMREHLNTIKPDVFYILLDTFMLFQSNFLNQDTSPAKTVFWFPSDGGGGLPKDCENILKKVDKPIAMAQFGQKQVKDYYNIESGHIPHGTDPDRLFRLPDKEREELRRKWNLHDKFVVGVIARNQPRKNLDRTIKTFSLLKNRIPNAMLFLHLDPNDPAQQVFNITSLIQKYGIENRVMFSGMKAHKGFGENEMNNVYNLMDVFFLSTSGEGFGIPIIEAMSAEVPVLATDYTTTPELVLDNKAGLGIKLSGVDICHPLQENMKKYDEKCLNGTITGSWEVERGFCDLTDAANKLVWMYQNPEALKQMGKNGRQAVLSKYDFNKIVAPKWEKLFKELKEG